MSDRKGEKSVLTRVKIPHIYVIIFAIILIAVVLTYIVPAGAYTYVLDQATGRKLVDPQSFHYIDNSPAGIVTLAKAIPAGMEASVNVIMMVVLIIAAFEIINSTGALNAGIFAILRILKGKESIVLAGMTILFAVIGGFLGWAEGILMFIPLAISMTKIMGYDNMLGVGVVMLGGAAGFTAGPLNVYTTGVCQGIAGLPLFSALAFRLVAFGIFTVIAVAFVLMYAKRQKASPANSYLYGLELEGAGTGETEIPQFTTRKKIIVTVVILGIITIAYGTAKWGWYLQEIGGMFILLGIIVGIIAGTRPSEMSKQFAKGAVGIIPSALVIGMARGVLYIMQQGKILDTIIHAMATGLNGMNGIISALFINIIAIVFNFFIISASSKAAMLMPILMPLGDIININRQVITVAFQFGDGFTNYFWPTSGIVMAGLAMGGNIPWEKWAKWTWKIFAIWTVISMVMIAVAQVMKLGPF
jgi:uncharacterized ion transporter superfamily protein YfcC